MCYTFSAWDIVRKINKQKAYTENYPISGGVSQKTVGTPLAWHFARDARLHGCKSLYSENTEDKQTTRPTKENPDLTSCNANCADIRKQQMRTPPLANRWGVYQQEETNHI